MAKLNLRSRLLVSHLAVMALGILTLASVGRFYSPRLFVIHLQGYDDGILSVELRTQLLRGFEIAWSRGMVWAILVGSGAAGGLSYLVSRRIVRPLDQMVEVTRQFASGHLQKRMPASEILEIQRLANSFNRMAADLEGVEKRRRELIGDLTHELRTPLTILYGYLEGLADGTIAPEAELYDRLASETRRLQQLVNDLQELSKLETGYLPIQAESLDLIPLMARIVQNFNDQPAIAEMSPSPDPVTVKLHHPVYLPQVCADSSRVKQIMINLIGNALRYTDRGCITVDLWSQGSRVYVRVTDTGIGIAPEDLPYVFERFWRADRSRNRKSGGTGLGLTICHRLVQVQGGEITVKSKLNQGSEFTFWLPQAPAA
ncbi:MAG: HAMP domain-containing histidine kinase [Nodosilinea sp. LVE1205-7]